MPDVRRVVAVAAEHAPGVQLESLLVVAVIDDRLRLRDTSDRRLADVVQAVDVHLVARLKWFTHAQPPVRYGWRARPATYEAPIRARCLPPLPAALRLVRVGPAA